jgi:hypothetical protein
VSGSTYFRANRDRDRAHGWREERQSEGRREPVTKAQVRAVAVCGALWGCTLWGCVLTPGAPAGPLGGPAVRGGVTFSYAYSPQRGALRDEDRKTTSNGGMYGGWFPLQPQRLSVRANPTRWLDIGADTSWLDHGFQLRVGPLDARRALPFGVELEWRDADKDKDETDRVPHAAHLLRGRLELYPRIGSASQDAYWVLGAGMSSGVQIHEVRVFGAIDYGLTGPLELHVARQETRAEFALGVHSAKAPGAVTAALLPWIELVTGSVRRSNCILCGNDRPPIDAPWGVTLVVSGALVWEPGRPGAFD